MPVFTHIKNICCWCFINHLHKIIFPNIYRMLINTSTFIAHLRLEGDVVSVFRNHPTNRCWLLNHSLKPRQTSVLAQKESHLKEFLFLDCLNYVYTNWSTSEFSGSLITLLQYLFHVLHSRGSLLLKILSLFFKSSQRYWYYTIFLGNVTLLL